MAPKSVTEVPPNVGPDAGDRAVIVGGRSTVGATGEGAGTKDGAGEAEGLGGGGGGGAALGVSDGEGATGTTEGLEEAGTTEGAAEGPAGTTEELGDAEGGTDDGEAEGEGGIVDGLALGLGGKLQDGPGGILIGSKAMSGSVEVSPAAFPLSAMLPCPSSPLAPYPKQMTFLSQRITQLAEVPETTSVTGVRLSLNEMRLARLTAVPPDPAMLATESFPF